MTRYAAGRYNKEGITTAARKALGLVGDKYPKDLAREGTLPDGTPVRIIPGRIARNSSTHRIQILDEQCNQWIPVGRIVQHQGTGACYKARGKARTTRDPVKTRSGTFDPTTKATASELAEARALGKAAFGRGVKRVPALDVNLSKLPSRPIGKAGLSILKAWLSGWDKANLTDTSWKRDPAPRRSRRDPMDVANTILAQLGGRRFIAMTGAKNLGGEAKSLSFKIPKAKNGISYVKITLDPDDTYTVQFLKIYGRKVTTVAEYSNVYADQLRNLFESNTGLYTSLGTMRDPVRRKPISSSTWLGTVKRYLVADFGWPPARANKLAKRANSLLLVDKTNQSPKRAAKIVDRLYRERALGW